MDNKACCSKNDSVSPSTAADLNVNCDFIVKVGRHEYKTHKAVLLKNSEYFRVILEQDSEENQISSVEVENVDPECVKCCIDYMYTDDVVIPKGKENDLLHVAQVMKLDGMTSTIFKILEDFLNEENFFSTKEIALRFNTTRLLTCCKHYEMAHIITISTLPEFQHTALTYITNILFTRQYLLTEMEKLDILRNWTGLNKDKTQDFINLLELAIDLEKVPNTYISELLREDAFINSHFEVYKLLNEQLLSDPNFDTEDDFENEETTLVLLNKSCLKAYDPIANRVDKCHDVDNTVLDGLNFSTVIALNSYIYVLTNKKKIYSLSFKDKDAKWEKMQDSLFDHGPAPPTAVSNGSLIVIGGSDDRYFSSKIESFDPNRNCWVRLDDKPSNVTNHVLVSVCNSIYLIGSASNCVPSKLVWEYDPTPLKWKELLPLRNPLSDCVASASDEVIFVYGFNHRASTYNALFYNRTWNSWTELPTVGKSSPMAFAHSVNGCIFMCGKNEDLASLHKYDPEKNQWKKLKVKGGSKWRPCRAVCV